MKIRKLNDILKEFPDFEPGWKHYNNKLEDPRFGSVEHIVVCDDDGTPKWDTIQISETSGIVLVPFYENEETYLGLIRQKRPIVEDKNGQQGNTIITQFPMGFLKEGETLNKAVEREFQEEMNYFDIIDVNYLGSINPLPAKYKPLKANEVYSVKVNPKEISSNLSNHAIQEEIIKTKYHPKNEVYRMIANNEIICGLTQAAFAKFIAWKNLGK